MKGNSIQQEVTLTLKGDAFKKQVMDILNSEGKAFESKMAQLQNEVGKTLNLRGKNLEAAKKEVATQVEFFKAAKEANKALEAQLETTKKINAENAKASGKKKSKTQLRAEAAEAKRLKFEQDYRKQIDLTIKSISTMSGKYAELSKNKSAAIDNIAKTQLKKVPKNLSDEFVKEYEAKGMKSAKKSLENRTNKAKEEFEKQKLLLRTAAMQQNEDRRITALKLQQLRAERDFKIASIKQSAQLEESVVKKMTALYNAELAKRKPAVQRSSGGTRGSGSQVEGAVHQMSSLRQGLDALQSASFASGSRMGVFLSFAGRLGPIGLAAATAIYGIQTAMDALTYTIGQAIKNGSEFEKSVSNFMAVVNPDSNTLTALTAQAEEFGQTTVYSAKDAMNAMTELAKLGYNTNDVMKMTGSVLNLASVAGVSFADSAASVGKVLSQMRLNAEDATDVTNKMVAAFNASALDFSNFSETMKYAGPLAGQLGIKLEDLTAVMGTMANAGIDGSTAGTALRSMLLKLSDPASKASKELKKLGYTFKGDLVEAFAVLQKGGFGPAAFKEMFGQWASTGATVAVNSMVDVSVKGSETAAKAFADEFEKTGKRVGNTIRMTENQFQKLYQSNAFDKFGAGVQNAEEAARKMMDNLLGDLEKMKRMWESFTVSLFGGMGDRLRGVIEKLKGVFEDAKNWADSNQGFIDAMTGAVTGLANAVVSFTAGLVEFVANIPGVKQAIEMLNEGSDKPLVFNQNKVRNLSDQEDYIKSVKEMYSARFQVGKLVDKRDRLEEALRVNPDKADELNAKLRKINDEIENFTTNVSERTVLSLSRSFNQTKRTFDQMTKEGASSGARAAQRMMDMIEKAAEEMGLSLRKEGVSIDTKKFGGGDKTLEKSGGRGGRGKRTSYSVPFEPELVRKDIKDWFGSLSTFMVAQSKTLFVKAKGDLTEGQKYLDQYTDAWEAFNKGYVEVVRDSTKSISEDWNKMFQDLAKADVKQAKYNLQSYNAAMKNAGLERSKFVVDMLTAQTKGKNLTESELTKIRGYADALSNVIQGDYSEAMLKATGATEEAVNKIIDLIPYWESRGDNKFEIARSALNALFGDLNKANVSIDIINTLKLAMDNMNASAKAAAEVMNNATIQVVDEFKKIADSAEKAAKAQADANLEAYRSFDFIQGFFYELSGLSKKAEFNLRRGAILTEATNKYETTKKTASEEKADLIKKYDFDKASATKAFSSQESKVRASAIDGITSEESKKKQLEALAKAQEEFMDKDFALREEAEKSFRDKMLNAERELWASKIEIARTALGMIGEMYAQTTQMIEAYVQKETVKENARYERRKAGIETLGRARIISDRTSAIMQYKNDKAHERRLREIAEITRNVKRMEIIGSAGSAILNAWSSAMQIPFGLGVPLATALTGMIVANASMQMSALNSQKFAKGGAFTNGVVSKPTNFAMGQMGEAGPEAIMPLKRMGNGSLGIMANVSPQKDQRPVQITYAPSHTFTSTGSTSFESEVQKALENDRQWFSNYVRDSAQKGYSV